MSLSLSQTHNQTSNVTIWRENILITKVPYYKIKLNSLVVIKLNLISLSVDPILLAILGCVFKLCCCQLATRLICNWIGQTKQMLKVETFST